MENYSGSTSGGYIPRYKIKQMQKKMKKSFQKADELAKQNEIIKIQDEIIADKFLEENMKYLDK
jgi:hypothetical protein